LWKLHRCCLCFCLLIYLRCKIMIKDLLVKQEKAKHAHFAYQLSTSLRKLEIEPSPVSVARAINKHYKSDLAKPHTVRKWILGLSMPKGETLLRLAHWLKVDPQDLIGNRNKSVTINNRISFEFDFTDQEVISKYLSMTLKQKITVRLLIDAITDKNQIHN